jgi:predicted transposase YbfD/YdcC
VVTFDALHTVGETMERVAVDAGADFLVQVKGNTPKLQRRIFAALGKGAKSALRAATLEKGHGRIEFRELELVPTSPVETGWPHTHCAFRVTRRRDIVRNGEIVGTSQEKPLFAASFAAGTYTPEQVLQLVRGHWTVENCVHHRKDRSMDEDRNRAAGNGIGRVICAVRSICAMVATRTKETFEILKIRFMTARHMPISLLSFGSLGEWERVRKPYKLA